jgi:hypothetical protein
VALAKSHRGRPSSMRFLQKIFFSKNDFFKKYFSIPDEILISSGTVALAKSHRGRPSSMSFLQKMFFSKNNFVKKYISVLDEILHFNVKSHR